LERVDHVGASFGPSAALADRAGYLGDGRHDRPSPASSKWIVALMASRWIIAVDSTISSRIVRGDDAGRERTPNFTARGLAVTARPCSP
jgi:hypothetical protein